MRKFIVLFLLLCSTALGELQYSGAVPTIATSAPTTRAGLADFIEATLVTAGWSCSGSTGDWVCTSAADNNTSGQIKVALYDPGSGNCAQVWIMNVGETINLSNELAFILPDGSTWTVIANKFHFYAASDGGVTARRSIHAGTIYQPSFLESPSTFGYFCGVGASDIDTTGGTTFRNDVGCDSAQGGVIWNATSWTMTENRSITQSGPPALVTQACCRGTFAYNNQGRRWWDDSRYILDPLIKSDDTGAGAEGLGVIVGQLWDCLFIPWQSFTEGDTITYDSKTWYAISNASADGTLFHYIPTP